MTARTAIIIWVTGACLLLLSFVLAYYHLPWVSLTRITGLCMETLGISLTVWKVMRYPGAKQFLDQ